MTQNAPKGGPRLSRFASVVGYFAFGTFTYFAYVKSKQSVPERFKQAWLSGIQTRLYPLLLKAYVSGMNPTDFTSIFVLSSPSKATFSLFNSSGPASWTCYRWVPESRQMGWTSE